jgi:uncharacterized protein (TIGR03435 family)
MRIVDVVVATALTGVVLAQTGEVPTTFEVASVKPSAPQGNGRMMMGGGGGPGTRDPGRYNMTNMPLKMLLAQAYDVKDFQVSGPSWLDTERFDITAKVPPGATKEQFRVMLQNLLIERFRIALHREQKELPIYTLSVAKNGPKLKETELDASAFAPPTNDGAGRGGPGGPPPGPPPPPRPGEFPKLPAGRPGMMIMFQEGRMRMTAAGQPIGGLVDFLGRQLGRPVVDKTGLAAKYDFQMEFAPDPGAMRGMPMPPPSGGGIAPGGGDGGGASDPAPNLITAVQQLGLKLDAGKGPVDLIVVDKAEKTPIEN